MSHLLKKVMLKQSKAFSSFSVNDIAKAKNFYHDLLGLDVVDNPMGIIELHLENGYKIILYPKPDHIPATFTVLNFPVKDLEATVDELTEKGISFEQYEGQIKTDKKGIFKSEGNGPNIAWFKDPSGNILSVMEEH